MLDAYLAAGSGNRVARRAFAAWAGAAGLVVVERRGILVASDESGRVVSAMNTRVRPVPPPPDVPCFTCAAAPVGTYHDASPRYGCRHDP